MYKDSFNNNIYEFLIKYCLVFRLFDQKLDFISNLIKKK